MGDAQHTITLEAVCDISAAEALLDKAKEAFSSAGGLAFNGAKVERITTPCIQIILSACKAAKAQGSNCSVAEPSDPMRTAFADLGLTIDDYT